MDKNSPIASWRNQSSTYRLEGVRCTACDKLFFPRVYRCSCTGLDFAPHIFSGSATLLSFTQVSVPCVEFVAYAPYCIGLVKLVEGPVVLAQLADVSFEALIVGMSMTAVFRRFFAQGKEGLIFYGIKFAPEMPA
jgi:uncharacterized OB-fold protein